MSEKRVTVWVQSFKDRKALMLQWLDPDTGKRKSKSAETDDKEQAEKARADLEYELNHGLHQEASKMSWERFRQLFEAEYVAGLREATRLNYQAALDHFGKLAAPKTINSINERTISAFVAALRRQPGRREEFLQPSTVQVWLQLVHTAISWAAEQRLLTRVPKFPVVKVPKKTPQPIPAESFEKLLEKAEDPHWQAFLLCGWLAGLRLAEAMQLEWEETDKAPWVDFPRERVWLPAEFTKATKDQWVPLDLVLRQTLEALPRQYGRKVFRFQGRKGLLTLNGISQRVVSLARLAGVKLTMKSLRAGFGCRYAGKVSAHVLQRLMRHSNIKTTLDYYVNIDTAVEEAILGKRNNSRNTQEAESPNYRPFGGQ